MTFLEDGETCIKKNLPLKLHLNYKARVFFFQMRCLHRKSVISYLIKFVLILFGKKGRRQAKVPHIHYSYGRYFLWQASYFLKKVKLI